MTADEIAYSEPEKKPTPAVVDASEQELRDASIRKLEKAQVDHQVRSEAGIDDVPKTPESIPKELPKMLFKAGSKIIGCDRFQCDDEEARVLARHMSVLIGAVPSKWYSLLIIVIVVIGKISDCSERIREMIHGKKPEVPTENTDRRLETKGIVYGSGI